MGPALLTSSIPSSPAQERSDALPQYGFGPEISFEKLIEGNPFLFRIHTPRERSPFYDNTDPYFVGQGFSDTFTSSTFEASSSSASPYRSPSTSTYTDVMRHLDWTTRSSSPYVSTSFSFAWVVYEATRRYHHGVKHDIEIAVIDAKAVSGRAVTAVELLRQALPKDRHQDHWKWYRFATESQDVLVWGYVPGTAVLASIPLPQILSKLPSYFLTSDLDLSKEGPMSRLAWDYKRKKGGYRQYCLDMSARFLRMSDERRLRDVTAGSVRLALAFLCPWFHKVVLSDFTSAVSTVCELAFVIAQWSGHAAWGREHYPETQDLIRCIVHVVGEEVREARRLQALVDATRMQEIVKGFERIAQSYQHQRSFKARMSLPSIPSESSAPDSDEEQLPEIEDKSGDDKSGDDATAVPTPPVETHATERIEAPDVEPLPVPSTPSDRTTVSVKPKAVVDDAHRPSYSEFSSMDNLARTASCFLTGFFIGSFVTLCMLAPDRRELAHWLS